MPSALFQTACSWLLKATAVLILAGILLPLIVIIAVSFNKGSALAFPPRELSLHWYHTVLSDPTYIQSIINSTVLALCATVIALVFGTAAGMVLTRTRFPGSNAVTALFMSPLVVPHVVLGVALLQLASSAGLARSSLVLVAGHVVLVLPYIIRMVLGALVSLDHRLEEASSDLGATAWETFRLVTMPLIKPSLIAAGLFSFVVSWTNVELSIFNASPEFSLIPLKIFNYVQYTVDPGVAAVSALTILMAMAMVIVIDMVVGIDRFASIRS